MQEKHLLLEEVVIGMLGELAVCGPSLSRILGHINPDQNTDMLKHPCFHFKSIMMFFDRGVLISKPHSLFRNQTQTLLNSTDRRMMLKAFC